MTPRDEMKILIDTIASYAANAAMFLSRVNRDLKSLKSRPPWETHADDALRELETDLHKTLAAVAEARKELAEKPLETSNV